MRARVLSAVVILAGIVPSFAAGAANTGWSLTLDPRHRAFLSWQSKPGEDRDLLLGCLRDVESFTARAEMLGKLEDSSNAQLVLTRGKGRFEAMGAVSRDQDTGQSVFDSDIDMDEDKRNSLAEELVAVLDGEDDIQLTLTLAPGSAAAFSRSIPTAGLPPLLNRFRATCFK